MPEPLLSFVSVKWIKPLYKQLRRIWDRRGEELEAVYDTFGDPRPLAACYVEPRLQHHNPADHHEDEENISYLRAPAFEAINRFLSGSTPLRDGRSVLFILSDAGMGKTSLLLMLKLGHLFNFWPKHWGCTLLKLGPDTLDALAAHPAKGKTVLLLDALDEDPNAFGRIEARLKELLQATEHFKRVILSCRTQFFPETGVDSFGHAGRVVIVGYTCPMYFMSLFDDEQVDHYLRKRFPDRARDWLLFRPNPWRDRAIALVKPIGSLRFRPLLLSHVESILGADADLLATPPADGGRSWTVYQLYEALVQVWLLREERKLAKQLADPPDHEALLAVCLQIAVHLQVANRRVLLKDELTALAERHPALRHLDQFDVGGRSLLNRTAEGAYRFSHYSIQEYLVVRALKDGILDLRTGLFRFDPDAPDWRARAVPALPEGQLLRVTDQMLALFAGSDVVLDAGRIDLANIRPEGRVGLGVCHRRKDGGRGPPMQLIPAGSFAMGSADDEKDARPDEQRQHEVMLRGAFALGSFPVTFDDYDRFCDATGRKKPEDKGWGRGSRPVINVSWDEANSYCRWLSEQLGATYRLPTEAEWEYACRAGSRTRWSFGDNLRFLDDHAWYRKNAGGQTHPVGEKRPNPWGLHDVHGNVWEWTQDCWHDNYDGAPDDGSAWQEEGDGDCGRRVLRGGSWYSVRGTSARPTATGTAPTAGTSTSVSVSPRTPDPLYFVLLPFVGGSRGQRPWSLATGAPRRANRFDAELPASQ